jgi:hypothetical protein
MLKERFLGKLKELRKLLTNWNMSFISEKIKNLLSRDRSITQPSTSTYKEKTMEDIKAKLTYNVTFMVAFTLCLSVLAMMAAFVLGLWAKEVDNAEIFKLLSPAFQTIVGGFIGLLAGVKLSHDDNNKRKCE